MTILTKSEVMEIADRAAETAVTTTLLRLGIDTEDPEAFAEFRKDQAHSHAWRVSTETVKKHGLIAVVSTLAAGAVGYMFFLFTGGKFSP